MTELDRRTLMTGSVAAGAVTGLVALSGCSGSNGSTAPAAAPTASSSAPVEGPSAPPSSPAGTPQGVPVAKVSAVPVGGGVVDAAAQVVVTQPRRGVFKGFSAVCTHAGCLVAGVSNGAIICPCHGSAFSVQDGSVLQGPASVPLAEVNVSVSQGDVFVG